MDYLDKKQKEILQAREMVKNHLATDINDALVQIQKKKHLDGGPVLATQSPHHNSFAGQEDIKKIKDFLQRFDKFFSQFYNSTIERMDGFSKEILSLKQEIVRLKDPSPSAEKQQTLEEVSPADEKKTASHHRSGKFNPSDVAIDKIFNNSNNQMMKQ